MVHVRRSRQPDHCSAKSYTDDVTEVTTNLKPHLAVVPSDTVCPPPPPTPGQTDFGPATGDCTLPCWNRDRYNCQRTTGAASTDVTYQGKPTSIDFSPCTQAQMNEGRAQGHIHVARYGFGVFGCPSVKQITIGPTTSINRLHGNGYLEEFSLKGDWTGVSTVIQKSAFQGMAANIPNNCESKDGARRNMWYRLHLSTRDN